MAVFLSPFLEVYNTHSYPTSKTFSKETWGTPDKQKTTNMVLILVPREFFVPREFIERGQRISTRWKFT
jgi:hypothetical protein